MTTRKIALLLIFIFSISAADAIVRKEVRTYKKTETGFIMEFARTMKRLSEFSRTYWSDPRILIEKGQVFNLKAAYTVNSRGQKIDVPAIGIHTLTPRGLQRYPYFSFLKEKTINFLGIDLPSESTLIYSISVEGEPVDETFHLGEPALSKEKTWKFLNFKTVFFDSPEENPEINNIQIGENKGIQIRFKDIPPYPFEPHQPPSEVFVVSTRSGWKELGNELHAIFSQEEGLSQESLSLVPGKDVYSLLSSVKKLISIVKIPIKYSIFKARSGEEAFKSRYASQAEMALILMDIYTAKGYKALPFFIASTKRFSEKVPAISQFEDAGVYLPDLELYITSDLIPRKTFNNKVLYILLPSPHFMRFPIMKKEDKQINVIVKITEQKIQGEISSSGNFILYGNASDLAMKLLKRAGLPAKITTASLTGNKLRFSGKLLVSGDTLKLHPDLLILPQEAETFALPRITPIDLKEPFEVNLKIMLNTAGNIIYIPSNFSISSSVGKFIVKSVKTEKGAEITYSVSLYKGIISPEEAERLKNIWAASKDKATTYIIYLSK